MSSETMIGCIELDGVGKRYKRFPSHAAKLAEILSGGLLRQHVDHWVIRDISFTVSRGESVALIGQNGAGKSTLLKLITGTTATSAGHIRHGGRIAALLELGIGFHPELTGRQNVVVAGQLLGLGTDEIRAVAPFIESFSELGPALDEPLRTYSSGMQARLAFSIATAVRPDILIVDEVLSVGDAYFQHKSAARIREFLNEGTTLLFVSHDPGAIRALCSRAILIDEGRIALDDSAGAVLDYYNALIAKREMNSCITQEQVDGRTLTRSGDGQARVVRVALLGQDGTPEDVLHSAEPCVIRVYVEVIDPVPTLNCGILIRDRMGNPIFGTNTSLHGHRLENLSPGSRLEVDYALPMRLGPGHYSITTSLAASYTHLQGNYDWTDEAVVFQVINEDFPTFIGVACLETEVSVRNLSAENGLRPSGN